jgi:hypothetical protein
MNFKTLVAPVAAITLAIAGVVSTPQAKADYYSTQRIGNQTYTYGSGGQRMNTQRIGNQTFYNGRTRNGRNYSGSCQTIGNQTFCN